MNSYEVAGFSVAIARRGQMVLQKGFGVANDNQDKVTPSHLFRIASVSKPVTSATIFSLIEQGLVEVDDLVFGTQGILGSGYGKRVSEEVGKITLHHLLMHTCGGWSNDADDPMFQHPELNHHGLIEQTINTVPLQHSPGERYAYSNFGYCVLGRVIEKIAGKSYVETVQNAVLTPCGIHTMQLATNTPAKNEVQYYGKKERDPYGMNISRMDSHGGWIGTPGDLVRFALRVDGFNTCPDILSEKAIEVMTTPTSANPHYACGWSVNRVPNWWHTGSLPGTTTLLARTASGLCWAAFANSRTEGIEGALDNLMWQIAKAVPAWQA